MVVGTFSYCETSRRFVDSSGYLVCPMLLQVSRCDHAEGAGVTVMQVERDCSCVVPAPAAVHRDITMTRTAVTQNTHSHSDIPDYLDTLLSSMSVLKT